MMTVFNHCDFIRYPKEEDPFLDYPCLRTQDSFGHPRTLAVLSHYGTVALVWHYENQELCILEWKPEDAK